MTSFKSKIGQILKKILPLRIYKLIANGFIIVPAYYKSTIDELELFHNLSLQKDEKQDFLLMKKYAHILDKGLHRTDAEPGHSKIYYHELKSIINNLKDTKYAKDPTYTWASEKLSYYEILQNQPNEFKHFGTKPVISNLTYEQLFELIKERRSNRYFLDKYVTEDIILKLKSVSNWAASSCNKQPVRLFVTNKPDLAKKCLRCCAGSTGFGKNIPSFWAFTANIRGYTYPSEMFLPSVDTSLGAQNVFLAAQTLGLSGTILSWGQHSQSDEANLRQLLNIPVDYSIIFCAVIGYAESNYLTPYRKTSI